MANNRGATPKDKLITQIIIGVIVAIIYFSNKGCN